MQIQKKTMNTMINITFPDGSVRSYDKGVTPYEIASSISPRLAADVLAASVNDVVYDQIGRAHV